MALNSPQRTTLLAAIKADPTANAAWLAQDTFSLLAWCNASSGTKAWRESVPPQDSDEAATYTTYDSLVAGKRDSWAIFLKFNRDFSRKKNRDWAVDVWGSAIANSIAEAILTAGTEAATNAQLALGGSTVATGTVSALKRSFAGLVDQGDANLLVNSGRP